MTTQLAARRPASPATSRDAIAHAALDSFAELGFHRTSMRHIAGRAGVTLGSIYHHFESKQEMLADVVITTLDAAYVATCSRLAATAGDTPARLVALVDTWMAFHIERRRETRVSALEYRSLEGHSHRQVVAKRDQLERQFRDVVEAGVAAGRFGTPFPVEATRTILQMGPAVTAWFQPRGPLTAAEVRHRHCRLALAIVESGEVPA